MLREIISSIEVVLGKFIYEFTAYIKAFEKNNNIKLCFWERKVPGRLLGILLTFSSCYNLSWKMKIIDQNDFAMQRSLRC